MRIMTQGSKGTMMRRKLQPPALLKVLVVMTEKAPTNVCPLYHQTPRRRPIAINANIDVANRRVKMQTRNLIKIPIGLCIIVSAIHTTIKITIITMLILTIT